MMSEVVMLIPLTIPWMRLAVDAKAVLVKLVAAVDPIEPFDATLAFVQVS